MGIVKVGIIKYNPNNCGTKQGTNRMHSLSFLLNQEIEIHITDFEHFFMFLDDCALEKRVRGNNGIDFFSSSAAPPTHQNTNVL